MKVKDAMHKGVDWVGPETAITELAKLMRAEDIGWHCQINANRFQISADGRTSGRAQFTPLGESGGAFDLEIVSAVTVPLLVEMIVDG